MFCVTIQQREALAAERLPSTQQQPVPPRTFNADRLRGGVTGQRAEQLLFCSVIRWNTKELESVVINVQIQLRQFLKNAG